MALKDYYKILEIAPEATLTEIKKNFRKLALRYHPDTNHGNRYAEAWYREIQEAYETLTNPGLREAYLQERWLLKSQGRHFSTTIPVTPPFILRQANELLEQVKHMDHFRMSHVSLQQQIAAALNDEKVDVLLSYNDSGINRQIVEIMIASMFPLAFPNMKPVIQQLYKLAVKDADMYARVKAYYQKRRQQYFWERYQGFVIFIATILLCLLIYLLSAKR